MSRIFAVLMALTVSTASAEWTTMSESKGETPTELTQSFSKLAAVLTGKPCYKGTYIYSSTQDLILDDPKVSLDTMAGIVLNSLYKEGERIASFEYDRDASVFSFHSIDKDGIGSLVRVNISLSSYNNKWTLNRQQCLISP